MNKSIEKNFLNWLKKNEVLDEEGKISLDKTNSISFQNIAELLNNLSELLRKNNLIEIDIMHNNNYKEAKKAMDALCENMNTLIDNKSFDIYLEVMNYYLKFLYTTYEKKYDIEVEIENFNKMNVDISNIYLYSSAIYQELSKWPEMYILLDKNGKFATKAINKNNCEMLCIPMFTNKDVIPAQLINSKYIVKKIKFNLFLKGLDQDKNNKATAIVLNPKFEGNDNVFIQLTELFWYYFADMSNYFD